MFSLKRSYASIMPLFNLGLITVVYYGGIVINLFLLNYKNYRIVLRVFDLSCHADDLFVRLGWQKLNLQRELKTATMVYKSPNGVALDYLKCVVGPNKPYK